MDEGIGRVLAVLDEIGARDTLVVFTSDNGGERFSDTYPLMGKKYDLLDGGIRVPYIVRWPTALRPVRQVISSLWGWIGCPRSLRPPAYRPIRSIRSTASTFSVIEVERNLYWHMKFRNQRAVRSGDWKYLSVDGNEFLYNLENDSRERANMRYREPEKFAELRDAYLEWDRGMPPIAESAMHHHVYTEETMAKSAG